MIVDLASRPHRDMRKIPRNWALLWIHLSQIKGRPKKPSGGLLKDLFFKVSKDERTRPP